MQLFILEKSKPPPHLVGCNSVNDRMGDWDTYHKFDPISSRQSQRICSRFMLLFPPSLFVVRGLLLLQRGRN